jgi:hypothetical protein
MLKSNLLGIKRPFLQQQEKSMLEKKFISVMDSNIGISSIIFIAKKMQSTSEYFS